MAHEDKPHSTVERHSIIMDDLGPDKLTWATAPMHLQTAMKAGLSRVDAEFLHTIDKTAQDKIFRKVDWRLCPMLAILYLISHLDR
jgi:hypothetical protein